MSPGNQIGAAQKDHHPPLLALTIERGRPEPGAMGSPLEGENNSGHQAARKQGLQSYNLTGLNSANNPTDSGSDSPLRAPSKE